MCDFIINTTSSVIGGILVLGIVALHKKFLNIIKRKNNRPKS